jgi:BirA family biotin operon repressor/biotin-[acetyl-CoA-carboxylase] ligase
MAWAEIAMVTRYQLLRHMADGRFHSGEELAQNLGVSRAAVWKHLKSLREQQDLEIHAVPGRGYRLASRLELLDPEQILSCLSNGTAGRVASLEVHDSVDSTNSWLMQQAAGGAPAGTVCLAERQTAGRGRRGRQWVSPYGSNIYLSVLWRFTQAPMQLSGLSLAAGIATLQALRQLGVEGVGLKWPNDLLWENRKLAGLLLEVAGEAGGPSLVVIGVGVNTRLPASQAAAIDQPWVDLHRVSSGAGISRNRLAGMLIQHLLEMLQGFAEYGLAPLVPEWNRHDVYLGRRVVLRSGNKEITGIHHGISPDGALLLEHGTGVRAYHAGEVSLRAP